MRMLRKINREKEKNALQHFSLRPAEPGPGIGPCKAVPGQKQLDGNGDRGGDGGQSRRAIALPQHQQHPAVGEQRVQDVHKLGKDKALLGRDQRGKYT